MLLIKRLWESRVLLTILRRKREEGKRRMKSDVIIQDVFARFIPECSETMYFSEEQYNATKCILKCWAAEMGAHVSECDSCLKTYVHYNSCKNRNCSMCQGMEVDEWIDKRQEDVLEAPYYHSVFTIPGELYLLAYWNQRLLYDALYHAVNKTMEELSRDKKHLGAKIGYICVLYTWGTKLNYHPHLHTIVLGGGLDEKNKWKDKGGKFFFPVKVMSAVFKNYYLNELKQLWKDEKLKYTGGAGKYRNHYEFKSLLDKLYEKDWIVYTKKAFHGALSVIQYLGKYTHRSAISNKRIVSMDETKVTFMAKNYKKDGRYEPNTISGETFIRRFLMNVLPKGFVRIWHYGLLASRCKKKKITHCRNLLGCKQYISRLRDKTVVEKLLILYNRDICKCKSCGEALFSYKVVGRYMLR